jgi:hypothetical protein
MSNYGAESETQGQIRVVHMHKVAITQTKWHYKTDRNSLFLQSNIRVQFLDLQNRTSSGLVEVEESR